MKPSYVICTDNVHGEPVVLEDSATGEVEKFDSLDLARAEALELNSETDGGYFVCRALGCGVLERLD